jgi:hypothetical protein
VDDGDPGTDCPSQIIVVGCGAVVSGDRERRCCFTLFDPVDVQAPALRPSDYGGEKSVHVAHRRCLDIDIRNQSSSLVQRGTPEWNLQPPAAPSFVPLLR